MTPVKLLLRNYQSPGDIVMMAYSIKALHEQYPGRFVTGVDTSANDLFEGNPYVTALGRSDPAVRSLTLEYPTIHRSNEYSHHFANSFIVDLARKLNLALAPTTFQGSIFIRPEETSWYSAPYEVLGRDVPYWIINAGHKSDFTAKAWAFDRYQAIVDAFPSVTFVQIGHAGHHHPTLRGSNLLNFVGKTDLRQLVRLVYNAFGVITPVSLPMVLAYAIPPHGRFRRRSRACIVIAGGREPNHWQQGPNQQYLHTCGMLDCCDLGGCWKSRVVPLGDGDAKDTDLCLRPIQLPTGQFIPRCMDMISVDDVCRLLQKYIDNFTG